MRTTVSKKNKYWISRHRYLELSHFCAQYNEWIKIRKDLEGLQRAVVATYSVPNKTDISDPTATTAEKILFYSERIDMVNNAAKEADPILAKYVVKCATNGYSYDKLRAKEKIPCCRQVFYEVYRCFFWHLSNARK